METNFIVKINKEEFYKNILLELNEYINFYNLKKYIDGIFNLMINKNKNKKLKIKINYNYINFNFINIKNFTYIKLLISWFLSYFFNLYFKNCKYENFNIQKLKSNLPSNKIFSSAILIKDEKFLYNILKNNNIFIVITILISFQAPNKYSLY